jgi:hypothetical protein
MVFELIHDAGLLLRGADPTALTALPQRRNVQGEL